MTASRSPALDPRRARPPAAPSLLALAVAVVAFAGCGDEPAADKDEEKDPRVIVRMTFDEVAYVDQALPNHKLIERVRHETESVFGALRKVQVAVTAKRQVDVDLGRLDKEPVTVVDPGSGITRAAVRVRYRFQGLALVPPALAQQGELPLGVLHAPDAAQAERVLPVCTPHGDAERAAAAELWTVFDPTLPACADAMAREQAAIDVARKGLEHPEQEVVSAEFERLYLPVAIHLRPRGSKAIDLPPLTVGGATHPGAPGMGYDAPSKGAERAQWIDKSARAKDEDEDSESLLHMRGAGYGGPPQNTVYTWSSYTALQPNWAVVYFAVASIILLVLGKRRQSGQR